MINLLFLEDDPILTDIIIEFLQNKEYNVDHAFDIDEANELIQNNKYDIFLFDVNVPNGNGFELLREIREYNINTPTIFVTALNSIDDMKKGFSSGCDDYIKKPFELDELELRLDNLKRLHNIASSIKVDDEFSIDRENLTVTIENVVSNLTQKEFKVLEYLIKNTTRIVSSEELVSNVWQYEDYPSDATIRTYIKKLRIILGNERIETIRGAGYRFIK